MFVEYSMDSLDQPIEQDIFSSAHSSDTKGIELSAPLAECIRIAAAEVAQRQRTGSNLKLENYVVLEQRLDFYLLQDPKTTIFYIWSTVAECPILKSTSWPVAYRAWLNLRANRGQTKDRPNSVHPICEPDIPISPSTTDLHDWVNRHQDCPQFGQLIYCRDRSAEDALKYGIQLSETVALQWTPGHASGILTLETVRRQHRLAKWIEPQLQAAIAAALHGSIEIFHQRWNYSPYQFNSEHWARLVATGRCGSFQQVHRNALSDASETATPESLEFNLDAELLLTESIAAHQTFSEDPSGFLAP
jgi:hypothetical protein